MSANFIRHFVIVATIATLMAFTVMTSSAYIFLLHLFGQGQPSTPTRPDPQEIHVFSHMQVSVEIQPLFLNETQNNRTEIYPEFLNSSLENNTVDLEMQSLINQVLQNVSNSFNASSIFEEESKAKERWLNFKKAWGNSKTFVLISTGLVFLAGLIQFTSGALIVNSGRREYKTFQRLATRWMITNCIVCIVLATCLSSYAALESDTEKTLVANHLYLSELERNLGAYPGVPHWTVFLIANIYCVILAFDILGLVFILFLSACLMNKLIVG